MTTSKSKAMRFMEKAIGGPLTIASMLEAHREAEGWSQAEVARRLGVSRAYVNAVEKGRRLIGPAQASRFAHVFDMLKSQWIAVALQDQLRADGFEFRVDLSTPSRRRGRARAASTQ